MERMTEGKDLPVCKFGSSVISDMSSAFCVHQ
jgi:hypothetical protein